MNQQRIQALQLASRFSLPPNALGYCGGSSAPAKLINCIKTGDCTDIENELEKFIVLNPYLKTISEVINKPKFSYEVIEAYSVGNDFLNQFQNDHYELLLENFLIQGVPDWFVDELRQKQPKSFIPHHMFQVLHVGVGNVSGSVPYTLESINHCMVKWGSVIEINEDDVLVEHTALDQDSNLVKKQSLVNFSQDITPDLKDNDIVAVHWKQVIKILSEEEIEKLNFWTNKVLDKIK